MKKQGVILAFGLAICGSSFAGEPQTVYGDWGTRHQLKWFSSSGERLSAFPEGAVAWVTNTYNADSAPSAANGAEMNAFKLVVDLPVWRAHAWFDNLGGVHRIGAGGVEFLRTGVLSYGCRSNSESSARVRLTANQTWKGPESQGPAGEEFAHFIVGSIGYYNDSYALMPLGHDAGVTMWNIQGYLTVWMNSFYNDLSAIDVTVAAPARLYLPESYFLDVNKAPTLQSPGKLKAKSLTLDGEGDHHLPLGEDVEYLFPDRLPEGYRRIRLVSQLDEARIGQELVLKNGADLTSTNAVTTVSLPAWRVTGSGESVLKGRFAFGKASNAVTVDEGATLFLDGEFSEMVSGSSLTVDGAGIFGISSTSAWGLTGALNLGDGVALLLRRKGRWDEPITGTREIVIDAGAGNGLYLPAATLANWTGTAITVRSGTLVLDDPLPGVTVTPANAVRYSGGLLVTDKARTDEIALSGGQTLEVYGSGLTASSVLTLTGTATVPYNPGGVTNIVFRAPATIAARINTTAGSVYPSIRADNCVTGTISGKLSVGKSNGLYLTGPGAIVLKTGGIFFDEYTRMTVADEGSLFLEDGDYKLGWKTAVNVGNNGRYIGIRNGAKLTVNGTEQVLRIEAVKDGTYKSGSTLEIGEGGTLEVGGSGWVSIGGSENSPTVLLSGGTLNVLTPSAALSGSGNFFVSAGGYSTGNFLMTAGTVNLAYPIMLKSFSDRILFKWYGGTIKLLPEFTGEGIFAGGLGGGNDPVTRNISVGILGADAAIDLSGLPEGACVTNIAPTRNRGEWYGDGTLTVKGGRTLVMHSMPNQAKLRLEGDGIRVVTDADTRYFDNAKCQAYAVWRRPYVNGGPDYYNSKALGLETDGFAVAALTYANGAASLVNEAASVPVAVQSVSIAANGVWDNETSVVSSQRAVTDLTIGDAGVWRVTARGADTARLTVGGTLTLGDAPRFVKRSGGGMVPDGAILSSVQPIVGTPEWATSRRSHPYLTEDGCGLGVWTSGLLLMLQ